MCFKILKKYGIIGIMTVSLVLCGCGSEGKKEVYVREDSTTAEETEKFQETGTEGMSAETLMTEQEMDSGSETEAVEEPITETTEEETAELTEETQEASAVLETQAAEPVHNNGSVHMVAIDAGHQQYGNSEQEPVGPGSSQTKAKVTGGTSGVSTGIPEYQLNLSVAWKLKEELMSRGYQVYMIRESNEVDISNSERAEAAYNAGADILVRIHANGSEDSSVNGAMTICMTASNPYNAYLYDSSRRLSENVLNQLVAATGARKEYVWETDTMSGINWSRIPVTIVEMGYMSNPDEDRRMAEEDYQWKIVKGIADGIDLY